MNDIAKSLNIDKPLVFGIMPDNTVFNLGFGQGAGRIIDIINSRMGIADNCIVPQNRTTIWLE